MNRNKLEITGRIGAKPVVRQTKNGKDVASVTVFHNESWMENGERREKTTPITVNLFGKEALNAAKYLDKGSMVCASGPVKNSDFARNNGNQVRALEISLGHLDYLNSYGVRRNELEISGNLGSKPELRHTKSGTAVTTVTVFNNEKAANGTDYVTRVQVNLFGPQAENAVKYLDKGSYVCARGPLAKKEFQSKENVQFETIDMSLGRLEYLDARKKNEATQAGAPAPEMVNPAAAAFDDNFDIEGDDIPF